MLVESEFHAGLTVPVPVGEYAGVGPPMELPSFGLTVRLRHAGCPASQPFGAVGIKTLPVRPWAVRTCAVRQLVAHHVSRGAYRAVEFQRGAGAFRQEKVAVGLHSSREIKVRSRKITKIALRENAKLKNGNLRHFHVSNQARFISGIAVGSDLKSHAHDARLQSAVGAAADGLNIRRWRNATADSCRGHVENIFRVSAANNVLRWRKILQLNDVAIGW